MEKLLDLVDDVKEKLSSEEYRLIMEAMGTVYREHSGGQEAYARRPSVGLEEEEDNEGTVYCACGRYLREFEKARGDTSCNRCRRPPRRVRAWGINIHGVRWSEAG